MATKRGGLLWTSGFSCARTRGAEGRWPGNFALSSSDEQLGTDHLVHSTGMRQFRKQREQQWTLALREENSFRALGRCLTRSERRSRVFVPLRFHVASAAGAQRGRHAKAALLAGTEAFRLARQTACMQISRSHDLWRWPSEGVVRVQVELASERAERVHPVCHIWPCWLEDSNRLDSCASNPILDLPS